MNKITEAVADKLISVDPTAWLRLTDQVSMKNIEHYTNTRGVSFLKTVFIWRDTKEGHSYWSIIHNRMISRENE